MIKKAVEKAELTEISVALSRDIQEFINEARKTGKTVFLDLKEDQGLVKIKAEKKYRTTNYALAAFLILKGFKLQEIVFDIPFIPQKGVFVFDSCPEIEQADYDFFNNQTNVSVQDFIRETNKLKHLLEDRMNRRGVYKYGYNKRNGEKE
jgi:hypothetical protein